MKTMTPDLEALCRGEIYEMPNATCLVCGRNLIVDFRAKRNRKPFFWCRCPVNRAHLSVFVNKWHETELPDWQNWKFGIDHDKCPICDSEIMMYEREKKREDANGQAQLHQYLLLECVDAPAHFKGFMTPRDDWQPSGVWEDSDNEEE